MEHAPLAYDVFSAAYGGAEAFPLPQPLTTEPSASAHSAHNVNAVPMAPEHIDFSSPEIWAMLGFPTVPEYPPVTVADFPPMPPTPSSLVLVPVEQLQGVRLVGVPGAEMAYLPGMILEFADTENAPVTVQVQEVTGTDQPFTYLVRTDHRTVKAYKCKYCDQMFLKKGNVQRHQQEHEQRVFACPFERCERRFETEQLLKSHFRTHRTPEELAQPYPCPEPGCLHRFVLRADLVAHLKAHLAEREEAQKPQRDRLMECSVCHKTMVGQQHLAIHMRTHTEESERTHECPYEGCYKAFKYKGDLTNHIRTHTGERPYKCNFPDCNKAFADHSTLRGHLRTHTGEKPHLCPLCSAAFAQSSKLKRHLRTNHSVLDPSDLSNAAPPRPQSPEQTQEKAEGEGTATLTPKPKTPRRRASKKKVELSEEDGPIEVDEKAPLTQEAQEAQEKEGDIVKMDEEVDPSRRRSNRKSKRKTEADFDFE